MCVYECMYVHVCVYVCVFEIDHKWVHPNNFLWKVVFFSTKDTLILLVSVEHYAIKMDIIRYYFLTNLQH